MRSYYEPIVIQEVWGWGWEFSFLMSEASTASPCIRVCIKFQQLIIVHFFFFSFLSSSFF